MLNLSEMSATKIRHCIIFVLLIWLQGDQAELMIYIYFRRGSNRGSKAVSNTVVL